MKERAQKLIVIYTIVLSVLLMYAFFCYYTNHAIPCIFKLVTGLDCPGCGISRFCISLLSLDIKKAIQYNYMAIFIILFIAAILITSSYRYIRYGKWTVGLRPEFLNWIFLAVFIIWGIIRNIYFR